MKYHLKCFDIVLFNWLSIIESTENKRIFNELIKQKGLFDLRFILIRFYLRVKHFYTWLLFDIGQPYFAVHLLRCKN